LSTKEPEQIHNTEPEEEKDRAEEVTEEETPDLSRQDDTEVEDPTEPEGSSDPQPSEPTGDTSSPDEGSPKEEAKTEIPDILPLLPVRDIVIYPYMIIPLFVEIFARDFKLFPA
jgi:hypothetical protein